MPIRNREALLSHGNVAGRRVVLEMMDAGIAAADPYENTRKLLHLDGDRLTVGPLAPEVSGPAARVCDLSATKHIYVVGGGKAVQRMAKAFEDVLGDRISEGHICIKKGETVELSRVGVTLAGHPLPDEESARGAARILQILGRAGEGDLVFWLRSGGGTALLALPAPGLTLADLLQVYRVLYFGAGASMPEANSVRNLVSVLNMKHQKYVRGATLFEFLADEIPSASRGHAHGLAGGTGDAYQRAVGVLHKYRVWDKVPQSIRDFLVSADPAHLPPSQAELDQRPYQLFRVIDPHVMLSAAMAKAREMGLNAAIFATSLNDVEAKPAGEVIAELSQEMETFGRPLAPPCAFICGGEVVVAVGQETGKGGRNQEFALAAASRIAGSNNVVIGSVDSDGTDGPTDVAGGIVDGATIDRIRAAGFDLTSELRRHNTTPVLEAIGDAVMIGNTGTNLRDMRVVYVAGRKT
jgi:glycerate 2-kinase